MTNTSSLVSLSSRVMTAISFLLVVMLLSFSSTVMTLIALLAKNGFTIGEDVTGSVFASEAFGDGIDDEVILGGG